MNIFIIFFSTLALCQYHSDFTVMVTETGSNGIVVFPAIVGVDATQTPIPTPVLSGNLTTVTTYFTPDVAITKNGVATTMPIEMYNWNTMIGNTTLVIPDNGGGRVVAGLVGVLVPLVMLLV